MKYLIYALTAALVVWSVWTLYRSIRRFMEGNCCDCAQCFRPCHRYRGK